MDEHSVRILYKRYEWISYRLEREAYQKQMAGRSKPLRRFTPCEKALVFTAAMGVSGGQVSSVTIQRAALTRCLCHNAMGEAELWELYDLATKEIPNDAGDGAW